MTGEAQIDAVLTAFGFAPSEVEQVEAMPQGIKNRNFRVRAQGREWVLKHHPAAAAARLRDSHRFEVLLAAAGFPVARLLLPAPGGTFVQTETGVFDLHEWVHGRQFSIEERSVMHAEHPDLAAGLGSVLGDLHREGRQALGDVAGPVAVAELLSAPYRGVAGIRRGRSRRFQVTAKLRRRPRTDLDAWFLDVLPDIVRQAKLLTSPRLAAHVDPGDAILAHNDVNWENLVFGRSLEVLAVLDFDNARALPRALEVGATAVVLVGADEARLERFTKSYALSAGVLPDPTAVRLGMQWKCVRSLLWSLDAYARGRVADMTMLETWCRHLDADLRELTATTPDTGR